MIIVNLYGGMGNQMFQYAYGRSLSLLNNSKLYLNVSKLNSFSKRKYELHVFNINGILLPNSISRIINFISYKVPQKYVIREKKLTRSNKFEDRKSSLAIIDGYWQSEKYFADVATEIKKEFTFKSKPDKKNKKMLDMISGSNSVSVHVRRGDYVNDAKTKSVHGVDLSSYYLNAVKHIKKNVSDPVYFVFSDDINWCKNNLNLDGEAHYVDHNRGNKSYEDLRLMSNCKHNIIANSSFSWWGAWLNSCKNRIVVAPSRWFVDEDRDIGDLIPLDWVKI